MQAPKKAIIVLFASGTESPANPREDTHDHSPMERREKENGDD